MNHAETPDDDPREQEYEQEFDDLSEKVILVQILAELQQIRMQQAQLLSGQGGVADGDETTYRCGKCQSEVPADGRDRHAQEAHNAPPGMSESLFTPVE